MSPFSQKYGEKQWGSVFKVGPHLSSLKHTKKHLALALKNNCQSTFLCIPN